MASIRSDGLHEPAGISFLIAENLLPPDPSEDEYIWKTGIDYTCQPPVDDEIVWTKTCVVWSRGGVVKRVFRLDLEKEEIRHALFTSFTPSISRKSGGGRSQEFGHKQSLTGSKAEFPHNTDSDNKEAYKSHGAASPPPPFHTSEGLSRALVVALKSQAHIFFLSGYSHVIPLPFEVHSVFATPRGLLFQRKTRDDDLHQHYPTVPPNSFASTSNTPADLRASHSSIGRGRRSSIAASQSGWSLKPGGQSDLPRVFSLMDPHSEMGLVVVSESSRYLRDGRRYSGFDSLGPADEVVYVSERNELPGFSKALAGTTLMLVVTVNTNTNFYTIWTARYKEEDGGPLSNKRRRRRDTGGTRSKRRSSHFGMRTGTSTPGGRTSMGRESFGPKGDGRNIGSGLSSSQVENRPDEEVDDLASRLGDDFGDIGVPLKASRHVSSLLARADLAGGQDRIAFSDLATGGPSSTMMHGGMRQSLGGSSTRGSLGFNPKGSVTSTTGSVRSTGGNFLDGPVDRLLDELNNVDLFEGFENIDLRESTSGLPEEILLSKVESFTLKFSAGGFQAPTRHKGASNVRISTLCPSGGADIWNENSAPLAICVTDRDSKSMAFVNLRADRVTLGQEKATSQKSSKSGGRNTNRHSLVVHATGIQHYENVWDSCKVTDGEISRIATLSEMEGGRHEISLLSPWSSPSKVGIPSMLMLREPYGVSGAKFANHPRERGINRVLADSSLAFHELDHPSLHGKIDVVDTQQRRHRLQIRMEPTSDLVRKMLKVCSFVLRDSEKTGDSIQVAWWEIAKWLRTRGKEKDLEWTAAVVMLFSMAVPYLGSEQVQTPVRTRKKRGFLRSSSGSYADSENWQALLDRELGSAGVMPPWMINSAWSWIAERDAEGQQIADSPGVAQQGKGGLKTGDQGPSWSTFRKNSYLTRCATLAREFLQSPQGITASGPEGCLPTAPNVRNQDKHRTALCTILIGLHLFREERKLSITDSETSSEPLGLLTPVLAQLGGWLGWKSWAWAEDTFYGTELTSIDRWVFDNRQMSGLDILPEPFAPPSIFKFLEEAWVQSSSSSPSFLTLLDVIGATDGAQRDNILWQEVDSITPRTLALNGFFSEVHGATTFLDKVRLLYHWGLTDSVIETFPEGVSAPLYETIMQSQIHASTSWDPSLLELIERDDLCMSMSTGISHFSSPSPQPVLSHDAVRDFHQIGNSALDIDAINSFEASAEADRFFVTRLMFREDKRFVEACRLLNQSKAPVAECIPETDWNDSDLLEAQKDIVQLATLRTLSIPAGRGMLSFSGRLPLLTEKLPVPSFSLQCVMKPSNVTLSADRTAFSEDKVCWAFFHNGVSTGLAISKGSRGIDTSWILFNKPHELTNRHAGFLLALGLNGHLKLLAKWVAFKYLTPKHTMTSIGLLLGLSVSYLGTMDTLITRLLSVHVTRMLPVGAAELNLSPLTQTAGIMGIGLLYYGSQHRRMSEVMMSEVENVEQEEGSTMPREDMRDEGYRLAAGFALGLINVAKGKDLKGMRDMYIVERLLAIAVGTKNVDLAHVLDRATAGATVALAIIFMKTNDEVLAQKIDIPDTTVRYDYVRPDLFLLRTLARHLIMWNSVQPTEEWFIQSLPKIYRRRYRLTGVRNLRSDDMPFYNIIAGLCFTLGLRYAGSGRTQVRNLLVWYLDQFIRICKLPVVNYDGRMARNSARNCQDTIALSAAAVMAGSGDLTLFRRLRSLHGRIDNDTPYGSHMAAHMGIGLLFLGGGSYTLGTSDLAVASLLCSMYPIFPINVLDNKCHLQAFRHLWVLAAEPRCLVARDIDTRRPVPIPVSITMKDGSAKQMTAPCLLPDLNELDKVELQSTDHWPMVLDFQHNNRLRQKFGQSTTLLGGSNNMTGDQTVYVQRKTMYGTNETSMFATTFAGLSEAQDILPTTFTSPATATSSSSGLLPASSGHGHSVQIQNQNIWDWIFNLPSLRGVFDIRERSLIMSLTPFPSRQTRQGGERIRTTTSNTTSSTGEIYAPSWLRTSAVDSKLVLEDAVRSIMNVSTCGNDDEVLGYRLWQLRLLFSWLDRSRQCRRRRGGGGRCGGGGEGNDEDDGDGRLSMNVDVDVDMDMAIGQRMDGLWLRKGFVEEARWRIWGVQVGDYGGLGGGGGDV